MEFSEIASVSGKPGLWKVLKPTRTGVILEALDGSNKKLVANMHSKVSVLSEISIYTTTAEGTIQLEDLMRKIHEEFKGEPGLNGSADPEELRSFLKHVLPDFDEERVYPSDIKKIVNWYILLCNVAPEMLETPAEEPVSEQKTEETE